MKLFLHIGMGKTGTSAIQNALSQNSAKLRSQKCHYLGMWFDMIDPSFKGLANQVKFFEQTPDEIRKLAKAFYGIIQKRSTAEGTEIFIMSNETFCGKSATFKVFVDELLKCGISFKAIGYARNPRSWLPSSYIQWGIKHKTNKGLVKTYPVIASAMVKRYNGLIDWTERLGKLVEIRNYDAAGDIVHDFAQTVGVDINVPDQFIYKRGEDCEILLRALFNNRFQHSVLPKLFDKAVTGKTKDYPSLDVSIDRYFDYKETDRIINDNQILFDRFKKICGIDLLNATADLPERPKTDSVRIRLVDYLIEITLDQARRIDQLEKRVKEINNQA